MPININNIFDDIPTEMPKELMQEIVRSKQVHIERIISKGHHSARGVWYDQGWDEWVLLLQGAAGLELDDSPAIIELDPGDHLLIPAHVKHRVAWTARKETTIWLAVHIHRPEDSPSHTGDQTVAPR